jgi:hypothetical protein
LQPHYFSGVEVNAVAGGASVKLLQLRAKRQAQAQRQHERALSALVAYQKLYPDLPTKEVAPIAAPAAVAARQSEPPRLYAGVESDATDSVESTPGRRPEERIRVGVSN